MKEDFLLQVDELVSHIEWKHKETYDNIIKYIDYSVKNNKLEQDKLKQLYK